MTKSPSTHRTPPSFLMRLYLALEERDLIRVDALLGIWLIVVLLMGAIYLGM
ncbi:hypothetical protein [Microbacterium sp. NPDC076895]|uniref:hypothetical protein n=1 Tax=Microbacterium sp. NPDC076895 TaxID=3154957 RepID=UPI0034382A96